MALPDEIWLAIFRQLDVMDLVRVMQVRPQSFAGGLN